MKPLDSLAESQQVKDLRRMKRIPLLLLLLMAVLFIATLHRPEPWLGWVHAFAEAGMVGALADWFAVVALFRHPLGIPIPHTAIIPRRKDELGDAMARFVADHFLHPDAVRSKLGSMNLSRVAISWLQSERGQKNLLDLVDGFLRWALDALDEQRVRRFLSRLSRRQLEQVSLTPLLGHTLDWLVKGDKHQQVFTQVLRYAVVALADNRDTLRNRVQQESPWWVPGFVDDKILTRMLDKIELRLYEVSLDPSHPMRLQFTQWLNRLSLDLKTSPDLRRTGEKLKQQLLENDELQDYLYRLWEDLSQSLRGDLDNPDSRTRTEVSAWINRLSDELSNDDEMQAWINEWLNETLVTIIDRNRHQISSLISDTVRTWDGVDTSKRVELAIGRDLQFIRINGTLVGGLVGLIIHAITLI